MKEKKNKRERKILEVRKTEDEEGKGKKITQRSGLEKLRSRGSELWNRTISFF